MTIEQSIIKVIKYFAFFNYAPTFEQIYTFLPIKTSKKALSEHLKKMRKKSLVLSFLRMQESRYFIDPRLSFDSAQSKRGDDKRMYQHTLGEYSKNNLAIKQYNNYSKKYKISTNKLNSLRFKLYIKLISLFPQIKLVGLSGTLAMMNAKEGDDIDLFIITAKNRLFTGRLIALFVASVLGMRRLRHSRPISRHSREGGNLFKWIPDQVRNDNSDKVCLNLFFDESNLTVPPCKVSPYVGHEILQMKPIINKSRTYEKFLYANRWVKNIFPNSKLKFQILNLKSQKKIKTVNLKNLIYNILDLFKIWDLTFKISNKTESFLKNQQLNLINRHKTTEIVTDSQLWFHPEDFGKKLASGGGGGS